MALFDCLYAYLLYWFTEEDSASAGSVRVIELYICTKTAFLRMLSPTYCMHEGHILAKRQDLVVKREEHVANCHYEDTVSDFICCLIQFSVM